MAQSIRCTSIVQEGTGSIPGNKCRNFKQIFRRYLFSVKFSCHGFKWFAANNFITDVDKNEYNEIHHILH